jgi:hypothetical protein
LCADVGAINPVMMLDVRPTHAAKREWVYRLSVAIGLMVVDWEQGMATGPVVAALSALCLVPLL